jgi:putative heme-binding domain-containing protein
MAVRDTRDAWLPAMQAGKKVFGGDANSLSYALNKVKDKRAIEGLVEVISKGELKGEALDNAVTTVASLGSPEQVGSLLQKAQDNPAWLPAIEQGVQYNRKEPPLKSRAMMFLNSKVADVRIAAAGLCGIWKVNTAEDLLVKGASRATTIEEALAMSRALAGIGATTRLGQLSGAGQAPLQQVAAVAAAARVNPSANASKAGQLLTALEDPALAIVLVESFLSRPEGPELLSKALQGSRLKEPVALAANRSAAASGRNVPGLLAALNKAGDLKPVSSNMSPGDRRKLIVDVRASGSAERGEQIYERTAMACTTCHLVNGKGGKLGPDLSTLGSYMIPESILESLLNPSTDIKQGYETVVVTRKDQTIVSGLLQRKTDTSVLVRDPSGKVISIPTGEVVKVDTSPVSLMPPGLTASLRRDELVDLMTFLTTLGVKPAQE